MKIYLPIFFSIVAGTTMAATPPTPVASKPLDPNKPIVNVEPQENPILKGAILVTEWHTVRNPFRFEESVAKTMEGEQRMEQIHILGFTRFPDEFGALRNYVFLTKTTEHAGEPPVKDTKGKKVEETATVESITLQSFPEILNEETTPSDEDIENSSITVGGEQLWFIGMVTTSNKPNVAVFWPYGPYPVKEENLKQFDSTDMLADLAIRKTTQGEKIGGNRTYLQSYARRKTFERNDRETKPTPPVTNTATQATNTSTNAPKPTIGGNPVKEIERILTDGPTAK